MLLTIMVFILILDLLIKVNLLKNYTRDKDKKMVINILFIFYQKLSSSLKSK